MTRPWLTLWLLLAAPVGLALTPATACADDDDDDEFETGWIGARAGIWYRPEIDMRMRVNGRLLGVPGPVQNFLNGTRIDIERDLDVKETAESDYMFQNGVLEAEFFVDTEWVSLSIWGVAPFRYEGRTVLRRTIRFGDVEFTAAQPVESKFEQWFAQAEIKVNLLNNEVIRLSPIVGIGNISIDWEIRATGTGLVGDTSDIDSPLQAGDDQLVPYPIVGAEVRAGIRQWLEGDLKLTGIFVAYSGIEGGTFTLDAGVTAYPISLIGVRAGLRYVVFDFRSRDENDRDSFDFDLEYFGFTFTVLVRF